jgi:hypothetical protein
MFQVKTRRDANFSVVTRLDRVIQYAAALMLKCEGSAILGRPVEPGDDSFA